MMENEYVKHNVWSECVNGELVYWFNDRLVGGVEYRSKHDDYECWLASRTLHPLGSVLHTVHSVAEARQLVENAIVDAILLGIDIEGTLGDI